MTCQFITQTMIPNTTPIAIAVGVCNAVYIGGPMTLLAFIPMTYGAILLRYGTAVEENRTPFFGILVPFELTGDDGIFRVAFFISFLTVLALLFGVISMWILIQLLLYIEAPVKVYKYGMTWWQELTFNILYSIPVIIGLLLPMKITGDYYHVFQQ